MSLFNLLIRITWSTLYLKLKTSVSGLNLTSLGTTSDITNTSLSIRLVIHLQEWRPISSRLFYVCNWLTNESEKIADSGARTVDLSCWKRPLSPYRRNHCPQATISCFWLPLKFTIPSSLGLGGAVIKITTAGARFKFLAGINFSNWRWIDYMGGSFLVTYFS